MKYFVLMMGCLIALVGCEAERDPSSLFGPDASGVLVVDALLIVDQPLPRVLISETVKANVGSFGRWEASVDDAEVVITQGERTFLYSPGFAAGYYYYMPPPNAPLVLPNTTYNLRVRSQGREATAQTITPGRFDIREAALLDDETLEVIRPLNRYEDGNVQENRVVYQEGLLEMRFDPLPASGYHIAIESLDPESDFVVYSDLVDEDERAGFERYGSSPAFEATDGIVRFPWFAVAYAGPHVIRIYAVDKNWFDLIRSVPEFFQDDDDGNAFQPGGLAGDNFERPLFNVDGGIGIFGSASVDSVGFVVLPRPSQ